MVSYLHTFLWLIINAVNTPGVEDVLPAERPHDDVGTFQISFSLRKAYSLTSEMYFEQIYLEITS